MATDRIPFPWSYLHRWRRSSLYSPVLLRATTAVLAEHTIRIATIGHTRGHDSSSDDALDHWLEHESKLHLHVDRHWTRETECAAPMAGVLVLAAQLDTHRALLRPAGLGAWRHNSVPVVLQEWPVHLWHRYDLS